MSVATDAPPPELGAPEPAVMEIMAVTVAMVTAMAMVTVMEMYSSQKINHPNDKGDKQVHVVRTVYYRTIEVTK